ncbi:hypothetical protein BH10BAC5_BH10BAC5_27590 [soil metagenome]
MKVKEGITPYTSRIIPEDININKMLIILQTKKIDYKYLSDLKKLTNFNDEDISELLDITVKTYRSYRNPNAEFKDYLKERILMLSTLFKHGTEVFGTTEKFKEWLNSENFFYGGKAPGSLLNTFSGLKFIDDSLTGIEYGDNV